MTERYGSMFDPHLTHVGDRWRGIGREHGSHPSGRDNGRASGLEPRYENGFLTYRKQAPQPQQRFNPSDPIQKAPQGPA